MSYSNAPRYHSPFTASPDLFMEGDKPIKIDFHPWHPQWDKKRSPNDPEAQE